MRISDWSSDVCSSDLLAVNARDAMEGRGTLTIAVDGTALAAEEIDRCAAGDYVRIAVSDTGCGMTPEVLERVFEPFFTTKPVGKGTGLGLSQIFGFLRQSDGEIAIASTPGEGRSEEHTSELQSLMRISYAVFCLKQKTNATQKQYKQQ